LAKKYGYSPETGAAASARVAELLRMLAKRLEMQRQAGTRYYVGDALTAVDVYSATFMALFRPLPVTQCEMEASARAAFEIRDPAIEAELNPILLEHRDMMYTSRLELPLSL
jgi:glutathione S-transferase